MSWLITEGTSTNLITGLPVATGSILVTEGGNLLTTTPVGEPPGGRNTTPGIEANAMTWTNPGWSQAVPGVPYGFSAPVYIGPLTV
jgi:hypothetical protein